MRVQSCQSASPRPRSAIAHWSPKSGRSQNHNLAVEARLLNRRQVLTNRFGLTNVRKVSESRRNESPMPHRPLPTTLLSSKIYLQVRKADSHGLLKGPKTGVKRSYSLLLVLSHPIIASAACAGVNKVTSKSSVRSQWSSNTIRSKPSFRTLGSVILRKSARSAILSRRTPSSASQRR